MSRWIDADAIHDALKAKQKWVVRCGDKHNEGYTYDQVHFAIDDAPSIDIVRCRECRYFIDNLTEDDTDEAYGECCFDWDIKMPKADDFCSYGEREGK